jgi:hypothetical protein
VTLRKIVQGNSQAEQKLRWLDCAFHVLHLPQCSIDLTSVIAQDTMLAITIDRTYIMAFPAAIALRGSKDVLFTLVPLGS